MVAQACHINHTTKTENEKYELLLLYVTMCPLTSKKCENSEECIERKLVS